MVLGWTSPPAIIVCTSASTAAADVTSASTDAHGKQRLVLPPLSQPSLYQGSLLSAVELL